MVEAIRASLRSIDPIIRHGGAEFVCELSAADHCQAEYRFLEIGQAIQAYAHVDELMERSEVAMSGIKVKYHSRV